MLQYDEIAERVQSLATFPLPQESFSHSNRSFQKVASFLGLVTLGSVCRPLCNQNCKRRWAEVLPATNAGVRWPGSEAIQKVGLPFCTWGSCIQSNYLSGRSISPCGPLLETMGYTAPGLDLQAHSNGCDQHAEISWKCQQTFLQM